MELLKEIFKIAQTVGEMGTAYQFGQNVGQLVRLDRQASMKVIEGIVSGLPAQSIDDFEVRFLQASFGIIDPDERIRAMELYAYFKVMETFHYRNFRGFSSNGNAL